jgi:putative membrane protein
MIRALFLAAALAAGLVSPALAGDSPVKADTETTAGPATQNLFTSEQARQHLMHLGYTEVTSMTKDESGAWVGRATKDGKNFIVAVVIKGPAPTVEAKPAPTN